jgi:hypothetical protein
VLAFIVLVTPSQHCLAPLPLLALTHCRSVQKTPESPPPISVQDVLRGRRPWEQPPPNERKALSAPWNAPDPQPPRHDLAVDCCSPPVSPRPISIFPGRPRECSRQEGDDLSVSCASCMRCMADRPRRAMQAWPARGPLPFSIFSFSLFLHHPLENPPGPAQNETPGQPSDLPPPSILLNFEKLLLKLDRNPRA